MGLPNDPEGAQLGAERVYPGLMFAHHAVRGNTTGSYFGHDFCGRAPYQVATIQASGSQVG
ncbi:MAG TPA: hypothetical protein VHH34_23970 [Pseudonocardiaceae bacterium]|nr:hypothetical protein [Pseudonocardiaceae bacterium]